MRRRAPLVPLHGALVSPRPRAGQPGGRSRVDDGGAMAGFLVAILVLAAVGVAGFFYFGGKADVNIKKPDVHVSSSETPK